MEKWRLLNTGFRTGAENMAIDETLLLEVAKGSSPPVIRFYGWSPPCLSLGFFQERERAVNIEACRELGVDCVRRPTGGRAVLHEQEVTYSVVIPEGHPLLPDGVTESYRVISQGILWGLQDLGAQVQMIPGRKGKQAQWSAACFDSTSWYEIAASGKKVVGSAQVRQKGVILQHGSVLLKFDPRKLTYLLYGKRHVGKIGLIQSLSDSVADLTSLLGREIGFDEVVDALSTGWEETLGVNLVNSRLKPEERRCALRLVSEKYGREEWNANRSRRAVE